MKPLKNIANAGSVIHAMACMPERLGEGFRALGYPMICGISVYTGQSLAQTSEPQAAAVRSCGKGYYRRYAGSLLRNANYVAAIRNKDTRHSTQELHYGSTALPTPNALNLEPLTLSPTP